MSIWFETRGLVDGEWHMIFCSSSEQQERQSTAFAIAHWDDKEYAHYEDIRMFHPDTVPSIPRHVGHAERAYLAQWHDAWEKRVGRRRVRAPEESAA